jgi:hypothetical protein
MYQLTYLLHNPSISHDQQEEPLALDVIPDRFKYSLRVFHDAFHLNNFYKKRYYFFLIVSTVDVDFCFCAVLTGMNFPVFALLPTLKVFPPDLDAIKPPYVLFQL